jgi:GntR family transcriptional regulator, transcriptional repressor for pyruvate dehydrogenase complex
LVEIGLATLGFEERGVMDEMSPIGADRPLLSDSVAQSLTQQIIGRAMMPGDSLPSESDIGKRLGVSKPVVREAIRKLSALGIVDIKQGKQTTVGRLAPEPVRQMLRFALHINPNGLRDAVELRRALETYAVRRAAEQATDEDIERLRAAMQTLESDFTDLDRCVAADIAFHQLIAHMSRNSLVAFLIDALSDSMAETISVLRAKTKGLDENTLVRHRLLVEAIAARDPEAAVAAMHLHFRAAMPTVDAVLADHAAR